MRYFRLIEHLPGRDSLGYGIGPGRWNLYGTPMIYASSVSSLNFLEMLSIKGPIVTQSKWKLVIFEVQGKLPELDITDLPENWKKRPYTRTTQEFGSSWAKSMLSPALKIPSCRISMESFHLEHNLLINPLHREFKNTIQAIEEWDVSFEVNH